MLRTGLLAIAMVLALPTHAAEVNLYSARQENLIKPLLDQFTEKTGIEVNLVAGNADALLQRLKNEGRNSPADLLLTTDAGRLHRAVEAGLTLAVDSAELNSAVPTSYRHPQGHWFGLSLRARPIMYAKDRIDPATLSTYAALADEEWKGRVCIRSSSNIYNQSLVASMIAAEGMETVQDWANRFVKNFARPPAGGDRDQLKAVAAGECDVAIANTYYLVTMFQSSDEAQRDAAQKLAVFWPDQDGRGAHVNISGAALLKSSKNQDEAKQLLEFLAGEEAQRWYAEKNGEYPVRDGVAMSDLLASWGEFKADEVNLSELGRLNAEAVRLMDRAGWR